MDRHGGDEAWFANTEGMPIIQTSLRNIINGQSHDIIG